METGMLWALGITLFGTAGFFVLVAIRAFGRYQRSRHQTLPTIAPEYPRHDNRYDNRYEQRYDGYDRRWVWSAPIAVAEMPAPHSRMCWSMRCPSDETNHLRVSQIW